VRFISTNPQWRPQYAASCRLSNSYSGESILFARRPRRSGGLNPSDCPVRLRWRCAAGGFVGYNRDGFAVHSTALRFAQDGFVDPFDYAQDACGDWVCLGLFVRGENWGKFLLSYYLCCA